MGHHLAVGEGEVGRRRHRPEVPARLRRGQRGAAELAVGERDAVARRRLDHALQVLAADLVAEPPRAGVDHHRHPAGDQPEGRGRRRIVHLGDELDLGEVVPRPQGAELPGAALEGPRRDRLRVRPGERAALLDRRQVAARAEAPLDGPGRAALQHRRQLAAAQAQVVPARPDAGGDAGEQPVHQPRQERLDRLPAPRPGEQPHAAVDVVAHPARRDDPLVGVHRRHSADREAVAPVDVRHGDRGAEDAGQVGDVGDLVEAGVVAQLGHQLVAGVDDAVDAHAAAARQPPAVVVEAFERGHGPGRRAERRAPTRRRRPSPSRCRRPRAPPRGRGR